MNCGVRVKMREISPALQADISRVAELWNDGLQKFGGPFLAGKDFTNADAMFCPVAYRVQSYGLPVDANSAAYVQTLLAVPAMQEWYKAALKETWRIERYESDAKTVGQVTADFRVS
jgi:glutathione S-transferase